jgi:hypothetical protein
MRYGNGICSTETARAPFRIESDSVLGLSAFAGTVPMILCVQRRRGACMRCDRSTITSPVSLCAR